MGLLAAFRAGDMLLLLMSVAAADVVEGSCRRLREGICSASAAASEVEASTSLHSQICREDIYDKAILRGFVSSQPHG